MFVLGQTFSSAHGVLCVLSPHDQKFSLYTASTITSTDLSSSLLYPGKHYVFAFIMYFMTFSLSFSQLASVTACFAPHALDYYLSHVFLTAVSSRHLMVGLFIGHDAALPLLLSEW